ncbi:MAG: type II toxin-antitoxin system RelE/ParE family toxin [Verrucomicrobia bacterium]|nr:type II toxin-antitoxin system RelE/ParE family toxin [Prolixibacteraceae bacterium]
MENIYKITWSDEALKNLKTIINYLETNWTEKELKQFVKRLEKKLHLIHRNPTLFPIIHSPTNIRKCVLSRQTSIYYQIIHQEIRLITLFDNKQRQNRLRNQLK